MKKTAVIYWSASGNTEAMAKAIAKGIASANCEVEVYSVSEFGKNSTAEYEKLALGCPSMGTEELEEYEFEPFLKSIESSLTGVKTALFGSYGWGDGEWMRNWENRMCSDGCMLFEKGLIINNTPNADGLSQCEEFGARFAEF